ncbi:TonB-dependent receptor [Piscinibacter sp. HJYY11]|uniref:TonB-dependent receptor n=1 Tax=Piscinibacter sp. HJYY11 TaxID=2801333 RepID=UPI00191F9A2C|nr:TonB-dependent receptor [Piscinibacter sp. HJYY11]MBL0726877.1 TonB-dependent receptor [Piscinibacter sp. HJYY11]
MFAFRFAVAGACLAASLPSFVSAQQATPPATPASTPSSSFNPAISLILNGTYARLSRDPETYRFQGFIPSGGEIGPGGRSFQLGESELTLTAAIDPTFNGRFTAAVTPENEVEVEEAWFERTGLFNGATLKGGRFLSSIGYLNGQHAHAWDFADAPLAYQAFFGGAFKNDGLQLRWLAPTDRFIELGAEVGAGRSFPGSDTSRNGAGVFALTAHLGDDLGASSSWRAGVSWLRHRATDRAFEDTDAGGTAIVNSFTGRSTTWVLDAVYKWAPQGNATQRNLKVQAEYFQRRESGDLSFDNDSAVGGPFSDSYRSRQSGWYAQAVYQFMPRWRAGARYDRLDSGTARIGLVDNGTLTAADFPSLAKATPERSTVMLDYAPSEFSRVRLQFAADRSRGDGTDRQVFLQYIMSLGAHGAHTF